MSKYTRKCPECRRKIVHANRDILLKSVKENRLCKSCCQTGKTFSKELCYIDGYDKEHNVVLEYDSKYHLKLSQQNKDKKRQQKIIDILKPRRFWRYDAVNKTFVNVVGES